ncbi:hypothetical protein ACWCOV_38305 [Kribbella sp. NPDC002412]
MASAALGRWQTERSAALDNLVAAHSAVSGGSPGRKWLTVEVNHALIVRLAAEFQGYCRDLHDEAIDAFLNSKLSSEAQTATVVRALLTTGRKLDIGNANWGNIGSDFAKFGVSVATELKAAYPRRYRGWTGKLDRLILARNAIAHQNPADLAEASALQPLTLATFRNWRSALNGVAIGLDRVVGTYLKDLDGTVAPW